MSASDVKPTSPEGPVILQNPPRHSYSKDLLKHAFKPFGSDVSPVDDERVEKEDMDVDDEVPLVKSSKKKSRTESGSPKKINGKKRKGEGEAVTASAKKIKKAKKA